MTRSKLTGHYRNTCDLAESRCSTCERYRPNYERPVRDDVIPELFIAKVRRGDELVERLRRELEERKMPESEELEWKKLAGKSKVKGGER
jgi:hypothetical protein